MARDGRTIDVRRRWLPQTPRLREIERDGDASGFDLGGGDDPFALSRR
jgi:hypothetical protein